MAYGAPQVRAGSFDRIVTIQQQTIGENSAHEPTESYATLATVRAQVVPSGAREATTADAIRAAKTTRFRIRYRSDVTEKDRVVFDSKTYKILGLTEIGRREVLEIDADYLEGAP